jgi:hypothetical protein
MGDRANLLITQGYEPPVILYTHWCGALLPAAVEVALEQARPRWNDGPYLTRIVVQSVLEQFGARPEVSHGFGLATVLGDNQYPLLVIDVPGRSVGIIEDREYWDARDVQYRRPWNFERAITFEEATRPGALTELREQDQRREWEGFSGLRVAVEHPAAGTAPSRLAGEVASDGTRRQVAMSRRSATSTEPATR